MTLPRMKIKTPVPFPANISGTGGIKVSKSNGVWLIEPDFSQLAPVLASAISDPTTKDIWIWDPITNTYNVLTLAGLGDALYKMTSTTPLAVGTGLKAFVTQSGKDVTVGSWVLASSDANPTINWMLGQVTAYSGTTLTVNFTVTGGSGTYIDWTIRLASPPGTARSAGLSYVWSTNTAPSDPGAGVVKANNATFASITALYISETDADGNAIAAEIATWGTGTSTVKGRLKIYDPVTPTNFTTFDVTALADSGAYDTLTVTPIASGGSFTSALSLRAHFTPKGDLGNTGAQGINAGVNINFDSSTTMANPGSGNLRLNNATIASVTALAISASSADIGNPSISGLVNTWDDSTTSTNRGTLTIRKASAAATAWAQFKITGALTDNTNWLQIPLSYSAGPGGFSAADTLVAIFDRTGDVGLVNIATAGVLTGGPITSAGTLNVNATLRPAGRLTLASGTPVMGSTVSGASTVYYAPYAGNLIPIYDGTNFVPTAFTELSQATADATKSPAAVVANKNYDIFVWSDGGTLRATRGPAWSSDTSRGTGAGTSELVRVNGVYMNANAITNGPAAQRGTYVGTIRSNGSSTLDFTFGGSASGGSAAAFGVWNMYNRVNVGTSVIDTGAQYVYASMTVRQARASAGNQIQFIVGLGEDAAWTAYNQRIDTGATLGNVSFIGLGFDSSSAATGQRGMVYTNANASAIAVDSITQQWSAGQGWHTLYALEWTDGSAGAYNGNSTGTLTAIIRA